jgi:hypothetical protein
MDRLAATTRRWHRKHESRLSRVRSGADHMLWAPHRVSWWIAVLFALGPLCFLVAPRCASSSARCFSCPRATRRLTDPSDPGEARSQDHRIVMRLGGHTRATTRPRRSSSGMAPEKRESTERDRLSPSTNR